MSLIWYASYGSNLDRDRFDVYLRGGTFPGNAKEHPGARDSRAPLASTWLRFDGQVIFAEHAPTWGGAVAFFDAQSPGRTWFRCYLVTTEQFDDVVAQECEEPIGSEYALGLRERGGRWERGEGWYQTMVRLGSHDGVDVVTFTHRDPSTLTLNAPSPAYLATIGRGLKQASDVDVVDYLLQCPGVRGAWTRSDVVDLLAIS